MTFGVLEETDPLLAELISLAFESAGHDCLVFENIDHATRILHAIKVDSLVLGIHAPDRGSLDWLESAVEIWPDLPSRTLLLTRTALDPDDAVRIERLGAEVDARPLSLVGIELVVIGQVQKARYGAHGRSRRGGERPSPHGLVN